MRTWTILLLLVGVAEARKPKSKEPPAPPPLTSAAELDLARLNAWVAELVPQVEAAGGARFERVPHARFGTPEELSRILVEESLMVMSRIVEGDPHEIERLARESGASPYGIVGKYGIATKVLYLSTESVDAMVGSGGLEPGDVEVVAKLVLAHELAHALQDQAAGMEARFRSVPDEDALNALRAATEGHANQVERDVAAANGWTRVQEALDAKQGWDASGPKGPGAWDAWASYGRGRDWLDAVRGQGGSEAVWRLLREPPQTTAAVFRPEASFQRATLPESWGGAVGGVDQTLTTGPWTRMPGYVGEWALREESFGIEPAALDAVLAHYVGGQGLSAKRPDRSAEVRLLRFESADWAAAWIDLARAHAETAGRDASGLGIHLQVSTFDLVACDVGLERVAGLGDLVAYEARTVWCARGDTVAMVSTHGFRPGKRLPSAVAQVWERAGP